MLLLQVKTYLKEMAEGQNTLVDNGGVRLSGGQQARIALARTLLNSDKTAYYLCNYKAFSKKNVKGRNTK